MTLSRSQQQICHCGSQLWKTPPKLHAESFLTEIDHEAGNDCTWHVLLFISKRCTNSVTSNSPRNRGEPQALLFRLKGLVLSSSHSRPCKSRSLGPAKDLYHHPTTAKARPDRRSPPFARALPTRSGLDVAARRSARIGSAVGMSDWTYEMLRYAFSWNDEPLGACGSCVFPFSGQKNRF